MNKAPPPKKHDATVIAFLPDADEIEQARDAMLALLKSGGEGPSGRAIWRSARNSMPPSRVLNRVTSPSLAVG